MFVLPLFTLYTFIDNAGARFLIEIHVSLLETSIFVWGLYYHLLHVDLQKASPECVKHSVAICDNLRNLPSSKQTPTKHGFPSQKGPQGTKVNKTFFFKTFQNLLHISTFSLFQIVFGHPKSHSKKNLRASLQGTNFSSMAFPCALGAMMHAWSHHASHYGG